jgi:hypothetical protein
MGPLRHRPARAALSIILFLPDRSYMVFFVPTHEGACFFVAHASIYGLYILPAVI